MFVRRAVAALALCALLPACAGNPVAEGDEALAAGDCRKALGIYETALKQGDVSNADVGSKIEECKSRIAADLRKEAAELAKTGEFDAALRKLDESDGTAQDPSTSAERDSVKNEAYNAAGAKASSALEQGDIDGAVKAWQEAARYETSKGAAQAAMIQALVDAAQVFLKAGKMAQASAAAGKALAVAPGNENATAVMKQVEGNMTAFKEKVKLAEDARKEGKFEEAAKFCREALELLPGHPEVEALAKATEKERIFWTHFRLGDSHLARKEWDKAIEAFEKAKEADPLPTVIKKISESVYGKWMEEGEKLETAQKFAEAVEAYTKAMEAAEDKAPLEEKIKGMQYGIHLNNGIAREVAREWINALAEYEKAREFVSDPTEINRRIINVQDHIVKIKCDKCNGTGKVDDYQIAEKDGKRDMVKVGTKPCAECSGKGELLKEKN